MILPARHATTAVALGVVAGAVVLLWPTMESLLRQWTDGENRTYTHGPLIAAISLWLIWREASVSKTGPKPDWRIALPLALASLAWLIALRAGIEIVHQLMLPALLFAALCAALGLRAGLRYAFACAFLYFANSIWSIATGTLQSISVHAVKFMLAVAAVPAFVEGNTVTIPEGAFEVEGGCSGLHFFMVALALSALFGEIHRDRLRTRVWQMLLGAAVAMVANWLRILVVIIAGHMTNMQHYLVRVDHYYFGWALFVVAMFACFWVMSRSAPAVRREPVLPPAAGNVPPARLAAACACGIIGLGVGPLVGVVKPLRPAPAQTHTLPAIAGWDGPTRLSGAWQPIYPRADRRVAGTYTAGGVSVSAFVAEYDLQHQDKELIGYGNSLREGFDASIDGSRDVAAGRGPARVVQFVDGLGHRSVLAYFYRIGERRVTADLSAQIDYALATLSGPVTSRVVAAFTACTSECETAERRALDAVDAIDAKLESREGTQ